MEPQTDAPTPPPSVPLFNTTSLLYNPLLQSLAGRSSRELTLIASLASVLILMFLGSCVWCFMYFKRGKIPPSVLTSLSPSVSRSSSGLDDSGSSSKTNNEGSGKRFFEGWGKENREKVKMNGSKPTKTVKNIITPDKTIEFVIPTIVLPAQPISTDTEILSEFPSSSSSRLYSLPSTRSIHSQGSSIPGEIYPQLVQGEEDHPKIGFSLYYEAESQLLYVRLLGGKNMPGHVRHCVSVKLYPGHGGKQKSREFLDKSPLYNQEFNFHVRKSTLSTRVLRFKAVIPESPKKKLIGCLNISLKNLPGFDVESEDSSQQQSDHDVQSGHVWKYLEQTSADSTEGIGLRVCLQWDPDPPPGLLTLKVIEASGLHQNTSGDYTSSYVKVTLQEQGRSVKSRKTRLVRWGSLSVYEDVFVVTIPFELLSQVSFLLELICRGRLGSKVGLGKITIGSLPYASPSSDREGTDIWETMCHQPKTEVVRWLQLTC